MNTFPYMPLYWNDMLSDNKVRVMSNEELGAYVRLLAAAWHEDIPGTLPDDEETLARLAAVQPSRWRRICGRVLACFTRNEQTSRREQKRMMSEYASLVDRSDRRSDAGAKAAAARWNRAPSCGDARGAQVDIDASRRNGEAQLSFEAMRPEIQPSDAPGKVCRVARGKVEEASLPLTATRNKVEEASLPLTATSNSGAERPQPHGATAAKAPGAGTKSSGARATNDDHGNSTPSHANAARSHARSNAGALRPECLSESNSNSDSDSATQIDRDGQPVAGESLKLEVHQESGEARTAPTSPPTRSMAWNDQPRERGEESVAVECLSEEQIAGARATTMLLTSGPKDAEVLTEIQALTIAVTAGVIPEFARMVHGDWSARGGRDGAGVLVPWARYLVKRWSREGQDWKAGTHRHQNHLRYPVNPVHPVQSSKLTRPTYANATRNQRPAVRNELERDRTRTGIESTAGETLRCL